MNHKWKGLGGSPVKGELGRKQCENCIMQVRRVRHGSSVPHGGWIEVHYRLGKSGLWRTQPGSSQLPQCEAYRKCPSCNGTGRITRREYKVA